MMFTLKVTLGNEVMQSYADLELATRLIFKRFSQIEDSPEEGDEGVIVDLNGNKVGSWTVTE